MLVRSVTQDRKAPWFYLRGAAEIEVDEFLLRADEIDYNEVTGYAEARGRVRFQSFARGETLEAEHAEYYVEEERGRFYTVRGTVPPKVEPRVGVLTTGSPFMFQGRWADRLRDRYILNDGFITNCRVPRPWWRLQGQKFDLIPGDRAIAHSAWFKVRRMPIFYTPRFYKSLEKEPRKSGFLIPMIGNSSRYGQVISGGYYWAINRSYDLTYRPQYFTIRGLAHNVDFRGKPAQRTDFDLIVFGVNDRGPVDKDGNRLAKQGGYNISFRGQSEDLPWGFQSRGEVNYLSSFVFRQAFTQTFFEAINNEAHSRGWMAKHWSSYALSFVAERNANYQSALDDEDRIVIRRLPMVDFSSRDRRMLRSSPIPIWWSLESAAGLVRRNQLLFQTRQYVERLDFAPRVMTALRWKGFNLLPSMAIRETHWGSSFRDGRVSGDGFRRSAREAAVNLEAPPIGRVFNNVPVWLGGERAGSAMKHVIETRAGFRWAGGIQDFSRPVLFDDTELLTNTKEYDYSVTNRLYVKKSGQVREYLSWELWQKRYLDPTLGGAVVEGRRNVFQTQTELTAYSFLNQPRRQSPVVSAVRLSPAANFSIDWRSDYDPVRSAVVNSSLQGVYRYENWTVSAGHNQVRNNPGVSPGANQFISTAGWARPNLRGWTVGSLLIYDFRRQLFQYSSTQIGYNTDCCGLAVQLRTIGEGVGRRTEMRLSFAVANIGSFGNLRRQERLF
ncbi:MAG: LPS assembly protein LptD [Acidobacteria bacterium]|nr:LPS assembly protein LptD [Acidobacteriota bacterium]